MKKTRFISGVVAAVMTIGLLPVSGLAYKLDERPPVPVEDVYVYRTYMDGNWGIAGGEIGDFGKNSSKALKVGGSTGLQQVKHEFGKGQDQGFQINFETGKAPLETAFKHGLSMISFDVQPNQTNSGILIFGIKDNKGNSVPTVVFTPEGNMYFNDRHGWNIEKEYTPSNARDYTADAWYTIKILIDANNGRFVYYLNDEYWGEYVQERTNPFNARVNPDLDMGEMLFNYHPTWQNVKDYSQSATAGGTFVIDNLACSTPKLADYDVICETGKAGNIYSGRIAELTYYLINEGASAKSFTLTTDFRTSDNRSAGKTTVTKTVPAKSEVEVKMSPSFVEYGFYTAYSALKDGNNDVVAEDVTRFSMVASAENSKTGFAAHPMTHGVGTYEETIDINKALGGRLIREELPWSLLADVPTGDITTTDWSNWQKFPNMVKTDGGEMLLLLTPGDNSIAGANWPLSDATGTNATAIDKWADYAAAIATNLGEYVDYYEIYNEWRGQAKAQMSNNTLEKSTAAYAELLKQSSAAIKVADQDAKIAAFCVFYDDEDVKWLDEVLHQLGDDPGQYFDIVTVHPYMTYYSKEKYPDAAFNKGMDKIKQVLTEHGVGDKPIYATEYGFSTGYALPVNSNLDLGDTDNDEAERTYPIDEQLKADFTARNLVMSNKYFEKSFMYSINEKVKGKDAAGRLLSDYEKGLGFTRNTYNTEIPYEAMPTALAFAGYNSILSGATYTNEYIYNKGTADDADDTYAYKFTLADGNQCIAMWNITGDKNLVSVNVGADAVTIYDMYGNEKTLDAIDGKLTFMLGTAPVYIKAATLTQPVFESKALFEIIPTAVTTGANKEYEISAETTAGGSYTIEAEYGANTNLLSYGAVGDKALKLRSLNNRKANEAYDFSSTSLNGKTASEDNVPETVTVKITGGGKTYLDEKLAITYDGSVGEIDFGSLKIDSLSNDLWWSIMGNRVDQNGIIKEKDCENGIIFKVNSDI